MDVNLYKVTFIFERTLFENLQDTALSLPLVSRKHTRVVFGTIPWGSFLHVVKLFCFINFVSAKFQPYRFHRR